MQSTRFASLLLFVSVALLAVAPTVALYPAGAGLPVLFFHGMMPNITTGQHTSVNLTVEGRMFVPLSFCSNACTIENLNIQVQLAIVQIREFTENDARFDDGYIIMAHSQGDATTRAVIEEMDDHRAKMSTSMAAVANGAFHGLQPNDLVGLQSFLARQDVAAIPKALFDVTKYSERDLDSTFQYDINTFARDHPEAQEIAHFNLARTPVKAPWTRYNKFLAVYNNLNPCDGDGDCERDQQRRRSIYLKLESAHYFASSSDGVVTPWESSILGRCNEVESFDDVKTQIHSMYAVDMKDTTEYQKDTYGLKTLDVRDGLFRYVLPNVSHRC